MILAADHDRFLFLTFDCQHNTVANVSDTLFIVDVNDAWRSLVNHAVAGQLTVVHYFYSRHELNIIQNAGLTVYTYFSIDLKKKFLK